ncbi:MAG: hypothetical protein A2341_24055 [Deltaproteobacteria bacterium RIFOXYB12_FULL_58_9]|nr:MAG: hypothetical protein A2341_24055 [Deltaproteobacteria bacterium RIFOXYB12_FULL_58_9]
MSASRNVVATFALDLTSRLLTVEKEGNGASAGSVTSAPAGISCGATCSASYSDGTSVTLTATPGTDNAFDGWGEAGASCGTATTCTISMTQARTVTASFTLAANTHVLSVYKQGTGAGTVTSSTGGISCGSTCSAAYALGTTVTLTATRNLDSTFGGWSGGGCSGTATTCVLTMTEDKEVTATFSGITQLLTVTKAGTGQGTVSATGLTCSGSTCTGTYNYNASVTLTASPTAGNTFAGWSGDGSSCGTAVNCQISMTQDRNVTATFTVNTTNYTLTVTKAGTGTGTITATPALSCSGNTCTGTFAGGTAVSITATPDAGSTFAGWGGACGSGTGTCSLNISSNTTATATFNTTVNTYALTVTKAGTGTGTVTSNPAGISCGTTCPNATYSFNSGTSVTLSAAVGTNSSFAGWSGDGTSCGTTATCVVTMSAAKSVTATFNTSGTTYALTVTKQGPGTIVGDPGTVTSSPAGINCGSDCTESYVSGTTVTLTATANASTNSIFAYWSGDGSSCGTAATCVVTMSAVKNVTASFDATTGPYALTVTKAGTGTGTVTSTPAGISCGSTCSLYFNIGTVVTLSAAAGLDSTFGGWSGGGCSGTATTCVLTMTEDKEVTATFSGITQLLTVTKAGTGQGTVSATGLTCSGSTCTGTYNYNASVTLTASPTAGNTFAGWSGDGSSCGTAVNCQISMTQDRNVTATFTVNTTNYTLTVTKAGTGTGTITATPALSCSGNTCTGTFAGGTAVSITATPDAGSTFAGWGGACGSGTGTCSLNISSNTTATATFNTTVNTYALTVTKAGTGTGTVTSNPAGISCGTTCPNATYSFNSGTSVTLSAAVGTNSSFAGWSGDGTSCGTTATCVVTMSAAKSVTATFNTSGTTYALTVTKQGPGTIVGDPGTVTSSPAGINCGSDCTESYVSGTTVTLTATANASTNSIFAYWSGDGSSCGTAATCVVTMSAVKNVTASFDATTGPYALTVTKAGTGTGTVTSTPAGISCGSTCSLYFNIGTVVTLSAAAGASSTFAGWSGDGASCGTAATCVVTMNAAKSVTATFNTTGPSYTLTVDPTTGSGLGTVTSSPPGINCGSGGSDCTESYVSGTTITLTAAPNAISNFTGWGGDKDTCTTATTCVLTMNLARNVTAKFALKTYTLSVYKEGTGTVTSTPEGIACGGYCGAVYDHGTVVTLTAAPGTNYAFSGWSGGGGCGGGGIVQCAFTIEADTTITATFVPSYTLTVNKTGDGASNGTVTSTPAGINCGTTCASTFAQGTVVTLTADAPYGTLFGGWSGCSSVNGSTCTVNLGANTTVGAVFTKLSFSLTVHKNGGTCATSSTLTSSPAGINCGSTCNSNFTHGTQVTVTANPGYGCALSEWTAGCSGGSSNSCTVTMDGNQTVDASFVPTQRIDVDTYGDGYVSGFDWDGQWDSIQCGWNGYACYDQCSVDVPEGTRYYFYPVGSHTYWGDACSSFSAGQACEITVGTSTMYVGADFTCSSCNRCY